MTELSELRQELDADAIRETGKTFNELHPGTLDDVDIEMRLKAFVLTVLVVTGTLLVMYYVTLKPRSGIG